MEVKDWKHTLGEMVREMMRSAEMERYFAVKLTRERAQLMIKQHSHYVRHRRDCWGYLSGNCPIFPIKRRIMEHEYEEMIKDEFSDHGHLELIIRQGAALGLSPDEILNNEHLPTTTAIIYGGYWLICHKTWVEGLAAMTTPEWGNDDRLLADLGGGHATRMAKKWREELGLSWKDMPNYRAHSQADEKHSDMFLPYLAQFAVGEKETLALKAAKEALDLFKVYRLGVAVAMEQI
jgi:pyrroloquinoline quinone (PQQ) biosynthesis protein C